MKHELGWYFPDGETQLPDWMAASQQKRDGVLQYQFHKYQAALKFTKHRRLAVDAGANVGLWSRNMAMDFDIVHAFEPVPQYGECWHHNMTGRGNARLHPLALGDKTDLVSLKAGKPGSSGETFVVPKEQANAAFDIEMRMLDSFAFWDVDFIKIDCEGYEVFVIRGAEKTIRRDHPCIIVEQKHGMGKKYGLGETDAVALLESWGAVRRAEIAGDFILSWT